MPADLVMPRLSDTMAEGTVARWLKKEGDAFESGETLAEINTDKATMPLEAFAPGRIEKILVAEGETVEIGRPIATLAEAGGSVAPAAPARQNAAPPAPAEGAQPPAGDGKSALDPAATRPQPPAAQPESPPPRPTAAPTPAAPADQPPLRASPMARRIAGELGVDLRTVHGSGPLGRIEARDVEREAQRARDQAASPAAAPAPAAEMAGQPEVIEQSRLQTVIARRMVESKTTVPHFYVTMHIDMGEAMRLRQRANEILSGDEALSVNDLVLKATALALRKFPDVNASYRNGKIERHPAINVGFAVAGPDSLLVPVVANCDRKSLREIAVESKWLAEKTRTGRLTPADYEHGTFTVSNLGMYGVLEFQAIVNPPQAGILAVGVVAKQPVVRDGELAVGEVMHATLSGDHRVFYGAMAAEYLRELRRLLENPTNLVL